MSLANFKEGRHSEPVACPTQAERISGGGKQILHPSHGRWVCRSVRRTQNDIFAKML